MQGTYKVTDPFASERKSTFHCRRKSNVKFAWIGAFSGVIPGKEILDPDAAAKRLRLLWLSVGDGDWQSTKGVTALHQYLDEKKVPHVFRTNKGGHEWRVWKEDLYQFAQLLFRDQP